MPDLLSGTVTLLFSDIEGSTRLLQQFGDRYADALEDHRRIVRAAVAEGDGGEVDCRGDEFFAAFPRARSGVEAAVAVQRGLAAHAWPDGAELKVRIGLHTGEPAQQDDGYLGLDVHRAALISAAAHGGQVLLSQTTRDLLGDGAPAVDLGECQLKDLPAPEHIFQLSIAGLPSDFPKPKTSGTVGAAGRARELTAAVRGAFGRSARARGGLRTRRRGPGRR